MMRRIPRQHSNRHVRRERDPRALVRQVVLVACGLLLVVGFFATVRQKFVAVSYGYESEKLRRERDRLKEEQGHLLLELQEASSPAQLQQSARKLGLQPTRPTQLGASRETIETPDEARRVRSSFVGSAAGGAALGH